MLTPRIVTEELTTSFVAPIVGSRWDRSGCISRKLWTAEV